MISPNPTDYPSLYRTHSGASKVRPDGSPIPLSLEKDRLRHTLQPNLVIYTLHQIKEWGELGQVNLVVIYPNKTESLVSQTDWIQTKYLEPYYK